MLAGWAGRVKRFVKVMPRDYKRVLAERQVHDEELEAAANG